MGAPTSAIANNPTASGGNVTPSSGGKGGGNGKSGMSSIQPSNQTLTANTAQPAMGAPAAYSNTIPNNGFNTPKTWSMNDIPASQTPNTNLAPKRILNPVEQAMQDSGDPFMFKLSQGKGQ